MDRNQLDLDLLLWNVGSEQGLRSQVESKQLYPTLEMVRSGWSVFVEDPVAQCAKWRVPVR